ncbi:MAG: ClpXP protease specificity-enhancing factor [Acinetobacter sp.]|nr:ClpXP protease specificity-enhancing factor [Acinetobacter sp.]
MTELNMTPNRPYLVRAMYEWLCDNELTPHLIVDATYAGVLVPVQNGQNGQIVLNVVPHAVHQLEMTNDAVSFAARFGGISHDIYVPMAALLGIQARENGVGLFFDPSEYAHIAADTQATPAVEAKKPAEKVEKRKKAQAVEKPAFTLDEPTESSAITSEMRRKIAEKRRQKPTFTLVD